MDFLRLTFSYEQLSVLCLILLCFCLFFVGLLCFFYARSQRKRRLERFEKRRREFTYTLPDRENAFVRDRLKGELRSAEETKKTNVAVPLKSLDLRLDYTRKTISKLKAENLSPADRLEVNRISKTVTFYALKNALDPTETRCLNDCFGRLLKLCAKYFV